MTVSAVVPLYNKARHIERAVRSILAQDSPVHEVIVVDDGSTDGGADLVEKEFGSSVHVLRQKNAGVSAARNTGIRQAGGDHIALLDSDDEWRPGLVRRMKTLASTFQDAGVYGAGFAIATGQGTLQIPRYLEIPDAPWEGILSDYFLSAMYDSPICSSSAMVPRQVFSRVGLYNESISIGEDIHLWGRIALSYPVCYCSDVLAVIHEDAENRSSSRKQVMEPDVSYLSDFQRLLEKSILEGKIEAKQAESVRQFVAKKKIEAGVRYLKYLSDGPKARRLFLEAGCSKYFRKRQLLGLALSLLPRRILRLVLQRHF